MKRPLYKEAVDENGAPIHFVPVNSDGVKGYRVVNGPSPMAPVIDPQKRSKRRAERARRKKHQKRRR